MDKEIDGCVYSHFVKQLNFTMGVLGEIYFYCLKNR